MKVAFKPNPYPAEPILAPSPDDQIAYGAYLADGIFECYSCHSENFQNNNPKQPNLSKGFYGGGNTLKEDFESAELIYSANITMDPEYGIGQWTKEEFANATRFGQLKNGKSLNMTMPRFTIMNDQDIDAIWAYLKSVPILDVEVSRASQ